MRTKLAILGFILLAVVSVAFAASYYEDQMAKAFGAVVDDDLITGTLSIGAASAQYVLPQQYHPYTICARGNRVYIECGAAGVTTDHVAGSYTFSVPDGGCVGPWPLKGPNCAYIGVNGVGEVEFIHHDPRIKPPL